MGIIIKQKRMYLLLLILLLVLESCVMDYKPLGYHIKNCTKDTLFVDLTASDTLTDDFYWGIHPGDIVLSIEDTTSVYIHGEKVILSNFYCVLPNATSKGIYPIDGDTCYIYAIKKQIITRYTLNEIRAKVLYNRWAVPKKEFHDRMFEYRYSGSPGIDH